jgi:Peptidase family M28
MHPRRSLSAALVIFLTFIAHAQPLQKPDAATAAWWAQTVALSNDAMEGRDTGTEAYERAAKYVAEQFRAAGLKPAGDNGTYFQRVPMHQTDIIEGISRIEIRNSTGNIATLHFPTDLTTVPRQKPDVNDAAGGGTGLGIEGRTSMVFLGYGMPAAGLDLKGAIVVFFNNTPADVVAADRETYSARRLRALTQAGVAAALSIDNPSAIEPFHWPAAYARSVTLAGSPAITTNAPLLIRVNPASLDALFSASGRSPAEILASGGKGVPLATFPLNLTAGIYLSTTNQDISSPNVLAILPGSDPKLAPEYVTLSAHLDGYGYGTPVLGDNLYNGTLDDAAYVALLTELPKQFRQAAIRNELHTSATHHGEPARSLLFCIFTGEEKGLLGSAYFTTHLTVPKESIVANLNLDQLRPIFPLNVLTMEGLNDSTLGETVRTIASQFKIEIRPDLEPERNLFRRADNYNFVRIGVPIAAFVFGYDKGSPEEVIYRDWYARRYHKPQDDIKTPIDWDAAGKFNRFYAALTLAIANAPTRPQWLPSSPYSPHETTAK